MAKTQTAETNMLEFDPVAVEPTFRRVLKYLGFEEDQLNRCHSYARLPEHEGVTIQCLDSNSPIGRVFRGVRFETHGWNECGDVHFKESITVRKGLLNLDAVDRVCAAAIEADDSHRERRKFMKEREAAKNRAENAVRGVMNKHDRLHAYFSNYGLNPKFDFSLTFEFKLPTEATDEELMGVAEWLKAVHAIPRPTAKWEELESPDMAETTA